VSFATTTGVERWLYAAFLLRMKEGPSRRCSISTVNNKKGRRRRYIYICREREKEAIKHEASSMQNWATHINMMVSRIYRRRA